MGVFLDNIYKTSMENRIRTSLVKVLNPERLEVINQSHLHAGHAGDDGSGQTHFKLIVASYQLSKLSRLEAQRKINNIIRPLYDEGLHALQIKLIR